MSKRRQIQNNFSKQKPSKTDAIVGIPPGFGNRVEPGLGALAVSFRSPLGPLSASIFFFFLTAEHLLLLSRPCGRK